MKLSDQDQMLLYGNLKMAIDYHSGKVIDKSYFPEYRSGLTPGVIYAHAGIFIYIKKLKLKFAAPALALAFLITARPIIIKWLELRENKSIEIETQNIKLKLEGDYSINEAIDLLEALEIEKTDIAEKNLCTESTKTK